MSRLISVIVLLYVMQQNTWGAPTRAHRSQTIVNQQSDSVQAKPPPLSSDFSNTMANIKNKLRSLAKRRDANPHFDAFSKRLDELAQKNLIPHAANASPSDFKKKRLAPKKNKMRKHQSKFLLSRSGVVGDAADATPQPLMYDSNGGGDNVKDFDGQKKVPGVILQPKNLY
ncbi:hypothetical protein FQR65_LT08023 [Abscondita terminalis]|nr:hypothetical protein FQR65_LT08023 [Abscondita terminalis]